MTNADSPLVCFVISPIGDPLAEPGSDARRTYEESIQTFEKIIQPACTHVEIENPIRADAMLRQGEITEQVFRHLKSADIVIADVTGANPNVMYELGLRHTTTLLTIQIGEKERLPFDVSVIRTIQFGRTEGGYIDARNALSAALEHGLVHGSDPLTATRVFSAGVAQADSEPSDDEIVAVDEPGSLEILADMEEALPQLVSTIETFGSIAQELTALSSSSTEEINQSDQTGGGARGRLMVAARFGERLDDPVGRMEDLALAFSHDIDRVDAGVRLILDAIAQGDDAIAQGDDESLNQPESAEFVKTIVDTSAQTLEFHDIVESSRPALRQLGQLAAPLRARTQRLDEAYRMIASRRDVFEQWSERASALLPDGDTSCASA